MDNFFTEFLSPDSLAILFATLGGFLIGFLTAWLMWASKAKKFEQEAIKWKKAHDDHAVEHEALKEELDLKEADLVRAERQAHEAIEIAKSLEAEKDKWQADLNAAIEDSVKAQAAQDSYQTTIEDLNNQIIGLKSMNAEMAETTGNSSSDSGEITDEGTVSRLNELEEKLRKLEEEHSSMLAGSGSGDLSAVQQSYDEAAKRLEALEAKMNDLESENDTLKAQLANADSDAQANKGMEVVADNSDEIFAPAPEKTDIDKGETVTLSAVAAKDEIKAAIGGKLPEASEEDKDDLTRIKGIGSFLEKKLNGLGIYTYEQISQLDGHLIERLTVAIEFFPGRIQRDDWVGQATRLISIKDETPEALEASAVFVKNIKDLKTVEGIGPKIEKLLKDNGIADLKMLSEATEKALREILFAAGKRYRIHDPTSWPNQAELAVNGEWEQLKALQDRLKGGRDLG